MAPEEHLTTGEAIYQAAVDLHNAGRVITRQVLQKITTFKMGIVDDHVTRMVDNGRLRRVTSGVLEVVEQFPANRPISKTVLANGTTKLEVGDQLLELTPGEARVLGKSLMGEAMELAQIQGEREVHDLAAKTERQLEEVRRQLVGSKSRIEELSKQVARLQATAQGELSFH